VAKPKLRSAAVYGKQDRDGFIHRSWMKSQGLPDDCFDGRPLVGICNTWSELTPCNAHLRILAEHLKRCAVTPLTALCCSALALHPDARSVTLIGSSAPTALYATALAAFGVPSCQIDGRDAMLAGLTAAYRRIFA
jgi:hypothetical protein